MKLFSDPAPLSVLPYDGESLYYDNWLEAGQANLYLKVLLEEIDWKQDELLMFGKRIVTKREVAWYGDEPFEYRYSNSVKTALPWSPQLFSIKQAVETTLGIGFNSCLLNLYHDGSEGMGWHSDDEPELGDDPTIASISLGASRTFQFKHKTTLEIRSVLLETGSLLLMQGGCQKHWLHQLPKSTRIQQPRINLTFRNIRP